MAEETHVSRPDSADGETVEQFEVIVEQQDGSWLVVVVADGVRKVIEEHPEEAAARQHADLIERAANRYDGAPRIEDAPDTA